MISRNVLRHYVFLLSYRTSPDFLEYLTFFPSTTLCPTLVGFPSFSSNNITFDEKIAASCSTTPPCGFTGDGFKCFLTIFIPSITTFPLFRKYFLYFTCFPFIFSWYYINCISVLTCKRVRDKFNFRFSHDLSLLSYNTSGARDKFS